MSICYAEGADEFAFEVGATRATQYQAASLSKPVTAALVLLMDARRDLPWSLDEEIGRAALERAGLFCVLSLSSRITLRKLLAHETDLVPESFPGYAAGAQLPEVRDVLSGRPPCFTAPVHPSCAGSAYGGASYCVIQALIEDACDASLRDVAESYCFGPWGMADSSFDIFPHADAAIGHVNGEAVPGGYRRYPELAAAGMWTTPTDLVRLARGICDPRYRSLSRSILDEFSRGEGPRCTGGVWCIRDASGRIDAFASSGANYGYRAILVAVPQRSEFLAVTTNSDTGEQAFRAVVAALAERRAWPRSLISFAERPGSLTRAAYRPLAHETQSERAMGDQ